MQLEPVTDVIGAEVIGVDLADTPSPEVELELDHALATYGVLFFREQVLTPTEHVAFGARFGELHIHPYERNLGGAHEAVVELDSEVYGGSVRAPQVPWHADATFEPAPPRASILRAVQLPSVGGDTLWASTYAVYDGLSSRLQRFVDELDAHHSAEWAFRGRVASGQARADASTEMTASLHPVVASHPVTGRKALFVNRVFTTHIAELATPESAALLGVLLEAVHDPALQVRLRWRPGTVAMWDNRCTQHAAVGGFEGRRVMQRVTIVGPPPKR